MPSLEEHEIYASTAVQMRTIYVAPEVQGNFSPRCRVLQVSPLLRELIITAMSLPVVYALDARDGKVMDLLLEEIRTAKELDFHVPMPSHTRLADICNRFVSNPAQDATLETWAHEMNMSSRTLSRLFLRETGMGFGDWCRRARIVLSLPRLAEGCSILEVALEHGYENSSAFAAMFRRELGVPPSFYSPRVGP